MTRARFNTEGHREPSTIHGAELGAIPAPLRGALPLRLRLALRYHLEDIGAPSGPWVVRIDEYYYALTNADNVELFAYHWHPSGRSWVNWPHLHLGPSLGQLSRAANQAHFPTGLVALEDVLRLAIHWFGVVPYQATWEAILGETRHLFAELCPTSP